MESQDDRREGELDEAREDGGELDGRRIGRRRAAHKIINNNRNNKTYFYFILIEKYAANDLCALFREIPSVKLYMAFDVENA